MRSRSDVGMGSLTWGLGALLAGTIIGAIALAAGARPAGAQSYEIWALDQGTNVVHIYDPGLKEVAKLDLGARGVKTAHMVDFTSDYAYAFIAATGSGDTTIIRTADRSVVAQLKTGPRTHMTAVRPDDKAAVAAVMGDPTTRRDGRLVEITIDKARGQFALGRNLQVAADPVFQAQEARFNDSAPICHAYTPDSRFAFVTLGPGLKDGGLIVLDTERFALVGAVPPDVLPVNCGTVSTRDQRHMLVNGGGAKEGHWFALDMATRKVVHRADSRGFDAHGVWATPDGREVWMVNRVTSNGIVINPRDFSILAELKDIGSTPDIIAMSPDSRFAFITLRGPNPVTAPHVAKGTTPGFAVVDIATRRLVRIVEPAKGDPKSDFHGIGVRVIR